MVKQKQSYKSPLIETIKVSSEGMVCLSLTMMNAMGLFDVSEGHGLNDDTSGWGNDY